MIKITIASFLITLCFIATSYSQERLSYLQLAMYNAYIGIALDEESFYKEVSFYCRNGYPVCELDFLNEDTQTDACTREFVAFGCSICLLSINKKVQNRIFSKNEIHALLIHEVEHCWRYIKRNIGEKEAGSEIDAYTINYISEWVFNEYDK